MHDQGQDIVDIKGLWHDRTLRISADARKGKQGV